MTPDIKEAFKFEFVKSITFAKIGALFAFLTNPFEPIPLSAKMTKDEEIKGEILST